MIELSSAAQTFPASSGRRFVSKRRYNHKAPPIWWGLFAPLHLYPGQGHQVRRFFLAEGHAMIGQLHKPLRAIELHDFWYCYFAPSFSIFVFDMLVLELCWIISSFTALTITNRTASLLVR